MWRPAGLTASRRPPGCENFSVPANEQPNCPRPETLELSAVAQLWRDRLQYPSVFAALRRGCRKHFSIAGTDHLRHIPAGNRGRRQSPARHHPVAGHVEILQPRQSIGDAPAQDARRRQPAFVTALPVAGIAHKGGGCRDVRALEVPGHSRKPAVEDTDDFLDDTLFLGLVTL